jgi:phytoene dehydrogenase-like protein
VSVAVVGSGPNGLAAAITLAEAGIDVDVFERGGSPGGSCRSETLIFDDCIYDTCASVLPLAVASPAFSGMQLDVAWLHSRAVLAHPLDNEPAVLLHRSLDETAYELGRDAARYRRLFGPLVEHHGDLLESLLQPLGWPADPIQFARFGLPALMPLTRLNRALFRETRVRSLLAGLAAHAVIPLTSPASSAFALMLGMLGHTVGWPVAAGGSQRVTDALVARLERSGGRVHVNQPVGALPEMGQRDAVLFDTSPEAMVAISGDALPERFRARLRRFNRGPGVFKIDLVLDGPIPWKDERCAEAITVHIGGSDREIADAEEKAWRGIVGERPFVILAQPSTVDASRAPAGKQIVWAYCHVPNGSEVDMTAAIERQIERFAPGFRERIVERLITPPAALEARNPNLHGGDITGGAQTIGQIFARPYLSRDPYRTPNPSLFLASSSTPPGGGVHGMCGYNAARSALGSVLAVG